MNTNLFRARLDAAFLVPLVWVGWNPLYRPDEPVDLDALLYDTVDCDEEWRRVEHAGSRYLYFQVATAEVPLVLFEWPASVEPVRGILYLVEFGLRKTFVVMRGWVGPNMVVAAFRHAQGGDMARAGVEALLSHGAEWFAGELFDELPARVLNRRPDLLPKQLLLDGYCAFAERVLGERERVLVEAYFETTYAEEPPPVPATTPAPKPDEA